MKQRITVDLTTPIEDQLKKLGITDYLTLSYLVDLRTSNRYLENVDDGKAMCNVSPNDARKKFEEQGRQGLTLREGLALYRANPKILKSHYLDLVASRSYDGGVPCLYLRGGLPALSDRWEGSADPEYGAPSAGSVLALEPRNLGNFESRLSALEKKCERLEEAVKGRHSTKE